MRVVLFCAAAGLCAAVYAAQPPASAAKKAPATAPKAASKAPPKAAPKTASTAGVSKSAPHTSTTHTPARTTTASSHRTTTRKSTSPVQASWRTRQTQPTPERYQEIQGALVAKGYLRQEQVTGSWDQNSVDALKRFQAEQKIDANGKITSMSLIALGLGPRHDPAATIPAAPENF